MKKIDKILKENKITDKQQSIREKRISNLLPYQYKKGQSGNPLGRYKGGTSGKERMKQKIANMTNDEFEDFIEGISKIDLFKMAEGNAATEISGQMNLKVEKLEEIQTATKKILDEQN